MANDFTNLLLVSICWFVLGFLYADYLVRQEVKAKLDAILVEINDIISEVKEND